MTKGYFGGLAGLQLLLTLLIISRGIAAFDVHEKAKYSREMNEVEVEESASVEYDEGDLVDDMRMFGGMKDFLESDTVKDFAKKMGKSGFSGDTLLSMAESMLGTGNSNKNEKKTKRGGDSGSAFPGLDALEMLSQGAQLLSKILPNEQDHLAEDDEGNKRPQRKTPSGSPLVDIVGNMLQSDAVKSSILQSVAAFMSPQFGGAVSEGSKRSTGKKQQEMPSLDMAGALFSLLGAGAAGGGGDGVGDVLKLLSNFVAPRGQKSADSEPMIDIVQTVMKGLMGGDLGSIVDKASDFDVDGQTADILSKLSDEDVKPGRGKKQSQESFTERRNSKKQRQDEGINYADIMGKMLPMMMGMNGGQADSVMKVAQDFFQSDYWKTGKEMFSKVDSHQLEAFGKMVTQVLGRKNEKKPGAKSNDPMDGLVDVLLSAAMNHFGGAEGAGGSSKQGRAKASSGQLGDSEEYDEYASATATSSKQYGKEKIVLKKKNETVHKRGGAPSGDVNKDLFGEPEVMEGLDTVVNTVDEDKSDSGKKKNKTADGKKKQGHKSSDPFSDALAGWVAAGKSEKQQTSRARAVATLTNVLVNFAAYGKTGDQSKFMQDMAQANFGIRPKVAELVRKYKIDSDFEGVLTVVAAILTNSQSMDFSMDAVKNLIVLLGHERMDKTPLYLASKEVLDILYAATTAGPYETAARLRRFVSSSKYANFRDFARFLGRVADEQLADFRDNEIFTAFPQVMTFFDSLGDLETLLGEMNYDAVADVLEGFFSDPEIIASFEKLLVPGNAEKVGTMVGNLVVGKDKGQILAQAMELFAKVSPSERATYKLLETMGSLQAILSQPLKSQRKPEKQQPVPEKATASGNHTFEDFSNALNEFATEGLSLEDVKIKEQFRLFISDFLTKLGVKLGKSNDPQVVTRAAESAERITAEVMDKVAIPSTMLDMILRPHNYADPKKLSELTDSVFKSPEVGKLLSLVDDFVSLNADVDSPSDLVTAVVDAVMESRIFHAFGDLMGLDVTDVAKADQVRDQLKSYLAEPLMSLVGIYVHSAEQPGCAQRWLCDFAGSVHLHVVKDSTSFWLANAYRAGGLVVAGVLSATQPEESLKFETLYQAIVDGKSGKACGKIYPANCGETPSLLRDDGLKTMRKASENEEKIPKDAKDEL